MKGEKRVWIRNCPTCNIQLFYTSKIKRDYSEKNHRECKSCSKKKHKELEVYYNFKIKKWERNCPKCNEIILYERKSAFIRAYEKNSLCENCTYSSESFISKMSSIRKGKTLEEVMSAEMAMKVRENSRLYREGKTYEELFGKQKSDELKRNHSIFMKNHPTKKLKHHSRDTIIQIRLTTINNIRQRIGQNIPNYNIESIYLLESFAKQLGITDLKHAENGGEFFIKELGYWVDGYSPSKNVVIEYNEKNHKYRKDKDEYRKKEIMKHLKCDFIIIWYDGRIEIFKKEKIHKTKHEKYNYKYV